MEVNKAINRVIPEGEMNCIWVEAGLVSYKLCDRSYDCEDCPFDRAMHRQSRPASVSSSLGEDKLKEAEQEEKTLGGREIFSRLIDNLFAPPLSVALPADRAYSRNHVWFMKVENNMYRLGIDHYAANFLEGVGSIILPRGGAASMLNNPLVWIIYEDGTVALRSPLEGKVVRSNPLLKDSAFLVSKDPYGSGWMSEIKVEERKSPAGDYCDAKRIEPWYRNQLEQLKQDLMSDFDRRPSLGVTLMDGGMRPRNLKDVFGTQKFVAFLQKLLSVRT